MHEPDPTAACTLLDRTGQPISIDEWITRQGDPQYVIVATTDLPSCGTRLETVWTGINYRGKYVADPYAPSTIFETRFYGDGNRQIRFPSGAPRLVWATLAEATEGHKHAFVWFKSVSIAYRAAKGFRPLAGV